MEPLSLTEGQRSEPVTLTVSQAEQMQRLGRSFASSNKNIDDDERTAIRLDPIGADTWTIQVSNAVGVLSIDGLRIVVNPKIPLPHLVHLLVRSGRLPTSAIAAATNAQTADVFWAIVAQWMIDELESLLRVGLRRGYEATIEELPFARGHIQQIPTAHRLLHGRARFVCEYEQFEADIALNRVLLAAAQRVASAPELDNGLRRRARTAAIQMGEVGRLREHDMHVEPVNSEKDYLTVTELAKHVVRSQGRSIAGGSSASRSFLIRTPEPVEAAIRSIAKETFAGITAVEKRALSLVGAAESLNPDLVFGGTAIGDVKYKLWNGAWQRSDLYQLVAFATGFKVTHGLRAGFTAHDVTPQTVKVGDVELRRCDWQCHPEISPADAEAGFRARLLDWWNVTHDQDHSAPSAPAT